LRAHPLVDWVNYVGFPDNPLYPMAHLYLGTNFCSLLTFGVKGGYEGGRKCFNAFRLFKRMVNMVMPNRCRVIQRRRHTGS